MQLGMVYIENVMYQVVVVTTIKPPNRKELHLGVFDDEEEAHQAYQDARKICFTV